MHRGDEFDCARVFKHLIRRNSIQLVDVGIVRPAAELARRAHFWHSDHLRRRRDGRCREVAIVVELDSNDLGAVADIILIEVVVEKVARVLRLILESVDHLSIDLMN